METSPDTPSLQGSYASGKRLQARDHLVAGYGTEQPVRLAVDPVGEVEDMGTAVVAAHPELDRPQAARGLAAVVDRDGPVQFSVGRDEGVNFAVQITEIADQQI